LLLLLLVLLLLLLLLLLSSIINMQMFTYRKYHILYFNFIHY